jgi:hypothetical protein
MLYGYLFYTNDSQGYCKSLITLLERHGLNKIFRYYLADEMKDEDIIRFEIETLPTIIVISDNGQQKQQNIYQGNDAFKWVDNFLISRRQALMKNAETSRRLIQNSNAKDRLTQKLYEYCPGEHSGISDGYSYYNDDETKDINLPQSKMFSNGLSYQNDNLGAIPLPGSGKIKDYRAIEGLNAIYGNDTKKAIQNAEQDRKKQDEQLKQLMEKDTLNTIIGKIMTNNN